MAISLGIYPIFRHTHIFPSYPSPISRMSPRSPVLLLGKRNDIRATRLLHLCNPTVCRLVMSPSWMNIGWTDFLKMVLYMGVKESEHGGINMYELLPKKANLMGHMIINPKKNGRKNPVSDEQKKVESTNFFELLGMDRHVVNISRPQSCNQWRSNLDNLNWVWLGVSMCFPNLPQLPGALHSEQNIESNPCNSIYLKW